LGAAPLPPPPFTAFEYQDVTGAGRDRMVFDRAMIDCQLDGTTMPASWFREHLSHSDPPGT